MTIYKIFTRTLCVLLPLIFIGCFQNEKSIEKDIKYEKKYLRWVGDIEYDPSIDNVNFKTCNGDDNILQYFNAGRGPVYVGEKPSFLKKIKAVYNAAFDNTQTGLIRIRFIVNCEGHAGRFRTLQSDSNFNETEFDDEIISQLINITKEIENWEILYQDGGAVDYYFYLIFKITNGQITEILP